jgi:hypothetical protein
MMTIRGHPNSGLSAAAKAGLAERPNLAGGLVASSFRGLFSCNNNVSVQSTRL